MITIIKNQEINFDMKKIMLTALCLGFSLYSYSQVITIKDDMTGEPLAHVTLHSENPRAFTTTNSHGQADLGKFINSDKIVIRMLGYETQVSSYDDLKKMGELILAHSFVEISELVVAATRWSKPTNEIPSKITSLSPTAVNLQNPQTAADLLTYTGKVFVQKSQQGGGSPMIRGFSTNRLLYTVDGVRMNTAIFRSGNLQNVISLDPFAIEKTEVFFGPGSVIYGSDAIGGVMSFQTIKPQLSLEESHLISGKAVARFSSANKEFTSHFDVNVGGKKWAMVSSLSYNNFGDLKMGSHGPAEYLRPFYVKRIDERDVVVENEDPLIQVPSGYTQHNLMQKILYQPNEKWHLQYGFHYSETSAYSRYDRHIRYKNGLPRYGEWSYGPQKWMMNNLNIENTGNGKLYEQLAIRIAHQYFEESRISRDINKPGREVRTEKVDAFSLNIDLVKKFGPDNTLYYGLEGVLDKVKSEGLDENIEEGISQPGPSRYPQADWTSLGLYITNQHKFSERFLVTGGLRYSFSGIDATFDTSFYPFPFETAEVRNGALTGSAGFVIRPTDQWVISANAATAFRSPNVDDMGKVFDSEPGSVVVPNPDLKAEYAYNGEIGAARIFNDRLKIDITGYYTYLRNAMVRRDFTLDGQDSIIYDGTMSKVQAIQNAAVARIFGLQAGLELKLGAGFSLSSDYNYQKGVEELDDGSESPSRHAPPMFGVTRIVYKDNKLDMQVYAAYSGKKSFDEMPVEEIGKDYMYAMDEDGNPWSPAWWTLNFKAMYSLNKMITITAGLENILNKRYRPYSSGIVAPGRNFIISLRMNW
jgi:hemoglobin/transferrin/lactoferrin receptor protein